MWHSEIWRAVKTEFLCIEKKNWCFTLFLCPGFLSGTVCSSLCFYVVLQHPWIQRQCVFEKLCSAELRGREESFSHQGVLHGALQGALLCWISGLEDMESSLLRSVNEFVFCTGLRLNYWIIFKISGMIMIKKNLPYNFVYNNIPSTIVLFTAS